VFSDLYDAETRKADDYLGELMDVLAQRTSLDDTLVIITSDHGENLGDHHHMGHSWCVYDSLAHVPLILRYPKRLQAGRTKEVAQLTDLLPTVMDAVFGRPTATPSTFGRSLLPPPDKTARFATTQPTDAGDSADIAQRGREAVVELITCADVMGLKEAKETDPHFNSAPYVGAFRALRLGPWKYITNPDGREELYNIADDPGEVTDLIVPERPVADRLAGRLHKHLATAQTRNSSPDHAAPPRTEAELRRRLRGLGYIN
jgi:arylsulfatase A-like enzyme